MQQGNFIDVFLARRVSGTYAHHQEHQILSCSICGWCRATESHGTIRTVNTTYSTALKTTTHPKTRCRKPYSAIQHLMLLMMAVCTRNMSS